MSGDAVGCSGHQGPDGAAIRRTEERGVGRQPTMEDVARECGVSRALVSIVFRRAPGASERTRARVLEAAERIGYRHNLIAARLASMSTRTFGVFIFDMRNALTADVFDGIQAEADSRGIGLVTGVSDPSGERDERTMRELHAARVDAVLLISAAMPGDHLREMSGFVPAVSLTRRVDGLDSVVGDDRAGGRMLTEHLLSLGHEHIAVLGPTWSPSDRVLGHEGAMRAAGLAPEVVAIGYDADAVARATRELLGRPAGERPPPSWRTTTSPPTRSSTSSTPSGWPCPATSPSPATTTCAPPRAGAWTSPAPISTPTSSGAGAWRPPAPGWRIPTASRRRACWPPTWW